MLSLKTVIVVSKYIFVSYLKLRWPRFLYITMMKRLKRIYVKANFLQKQMRNYR